MIFKKLNKRGFEDFWAWVVITLISVFLIFIYLVICFGYGSVASLTPGKDQVTFLGIQSDIASTESFIGFLNSQIVINGRKQNVSKAILDSFDLYYETRSTTGINLVDKYGLYNYYDISRTSRSQMISDGFDPKAVDKIIENNKVLVSLLKPRLDLYCKEYKFAMPFGLLTQSGIMDSSDALGNMIYYVRENPSNWDSLIVKIPFTYRGKNVSFEYTQLKACSNGGYNQ